MIRDGRGTSLIVVVCERWVAIGYFSRIKGLVQYHTKLCPFPFSLSLFFLLFGQDTGAKFKNLSYLFEDSSSI